MIRQGQHHLIYHPDASPSALPLSSLSYLFFLYTLAVGSRPFLLYYIFLESLFSNLLNPKAIFLYLPQAASPTVHTSSPFVTLNTLSPFL